MEVESVRILTNVKMFLRKPTGWIWKPRIKQDTVNKIKQNRNLERMIQQDNTNNQKLIVGPVVYTLRGEYAFLCMPTAFQERTTLTKICHKVNVENLTDAVKQTTKRARA